MEEEEEDEEEEEEWESSPGIVLLMGEHILSILFEPRVSIVNVVGIEVILPCTSIVCAGVGRSHFLSAPPSGTMV